MCREGGGKGSPGVITLMNPGPYRPLYLWGPLVGGSQTIRPLPRGGSSRPMVARLVRYGPVRQKITFLSKGAVQLTQIFTTTSVRSHRSTRSRTSLTCLSVSVGLPVRPEPQAGKRGSD